MRCENCHIDVLLLSMPFGPLYSPSIGLTLLNQSLLQRNIKAKITYFSIDFAKRIGIKLYQDIATGYPLNHDLVGEWIFASSFYKHEKRKLHFYIEEILKGNNLHHSKNKYSHTSINKKFIGQILKVQKGVTEWIENCVLEISRSKPKIVGFTSVFQQQVSSLFLAKKIKELNPSITVIFGGANVEGEMGLEYIKQFDFIDIVVSGEGDIIFQELVQKILNKEPYHQLKGVICKQNIALTKFNLLGYNAESVKDMDSLPFLNYDDYINQLKEKKIKKYIKPRMLFESSRGCWWGEIMHCTFCGLNGETMKHRSKSSERVLKELKYLAEKYSGSPISVVDNILDMSYFKSLIPELINLNKGKMELFYEVKANLKKTQVEALKLAGITAIQPGIESLSDNVLKLMRKGVKALQNIQLLIWCKEYGISAEWNILWGFPRENSEDYKKMTEIVPLISHLKPPHGAAPIRLDRFSPNFNTPKDLGFKDLKPYPAYEFIFPFNENVLKNLAYYFTYSYSEDQDVDSYVKPFSEEIGKWKKNYFESDLFLVDKEDLLLIWDFRYFQVEHLIVLNKIERIIYLACNKMKTINELIQVLIQHEISLTIDDTQNILKYMIANKIMIKDEFHYLSLAIPLNKFYSPSVNILKRIDSYVRLIGQYSDAKEITTLNTSSKKFSLINIS